MRFCSFCRVPNGPERTHCVSCREPLGKLPEGIPLPGQSAYHCDNCDKLVTLGVETCPHCGRVAPSFLPSAPVKPGEGRVFEAPPPPVNNAAPDALDRLRQAPPPATWHVLPRADGTVVLQRTTGGKLSADATGPAAALLVGLLCLFLLRVSGREGPVVVYAAFGLLAAVGLAMLLWVLFAQETLQAGPGQLSYRREWMGWGPRRMVEGNALLRVVIQHAAGQSGLHTLRHLFVEAGGKTIRLETQAGDGANNPARLGAFLSAQTGWPCINPEQSAFTNS